jgi:hypothetical protein
MARTRNKFAELPSVPLLQALTITLGVRLRALSRRPRDLDTEVFDGPYQHDMDATWKAGA